MKLPENHLSSDNPLNIIFAGTPEFAANTLAAILGSKHNVCAVYTQPDRKAGRGQQLQPSPVKALAVENNIPVYQPLNFKAAEDVLALSSHGADLMIVVAYGLLLPSSILEAPKYGCINVHASLLPRWRGAAPIQRAIAAGDAETGITIMQMDEGLDTGDMLHVLACPIARSDTGGELHDRLMSLGAEAILTVLSNLAVYRKNGTKQDNEQANYAHKLSKKEGCIDWNNTAELVAAQVRGFNPWPVCHTVVADSNVRIWESEVLDEDHQEAAGTVLHVNKSGIVVACGAKKLVLTNLQLPGKKALSAKELLNNSKQPFQKGLVLGSKR